MKNFRNKISLFKKCALIYVVFITVPTLFFAFFLYHTQSEQFYNQAVHDRKTALSQIADNIDTNFMAVEDLSNSLTYRNSLVSLISRSDLNEYPVWAKHSSEEFMINLKYSLKYQNLSITDAAIFTNNPDIPETGNFYTRDRLYALPFYQDFRRQNKNYDIYFLPKEEASEYFKQKGEDKDAKGAILLFVRKIQQAYYSGYQGVLILEVNADKFLASFSPYIGKNSGYYILFKNTKDTYGCLPASKINFTNKLREESDVLFEGSEKYPVTVVSQMALHKKIYLVPAFRMSLLLILMTVIQLFVVWGMIKYIFQKINMQITEMDKIVMHDFSGRISTTASNELSLVGQRYNLLLNKIDMLINDIVQKETDIKNAQIKALQYQINPHFIYNVLSIFAGNAEQSGNPLLSESISYFGHLLRYTIRDTGLYSTVEEELANAKALIKVYALHFTGSLELNIKVKEEVLKQKLIKFLLQPIIENSIIHAYPREYAGGDMQINISVETFDEEMVITIADNGIGMEAEQLCKIRENIIHGTEAEATIKSDSSFIGLHNIYKRLKLIYGEKSNLEIISFKGKGTVVSTTLPIINERE